MEYIGIDYLNSNDQINVTNKTTFFIHLYKGVQQGLFMEYKFELNISWEWIMTCEPSKKSCTKFHQNFSSQVLIGRWCFA